MTAFVYLLHFDRPHPNGRNPRHYLGVTQNVDDRVAEHSEGSSKSCLTRDFFLRGIGFVVAKTWKHPYPKAAFDRERRIKRQKKNYSHICPICKEATNGPR
jgi:predicted GIY-YIG superfamily endonuclease